MPNWCMNTITVVGDTNKLKKLKEKFGTYDENNGHPLYRFDFNKIIPEPKTIGECEIQYVMEEGENRSLQLREDAPWFDWYRWHIDHWGTKWNACDSEMYLNRDELCITFDTAWSAPDRIYAKFYETILEDEEFSGLIATVTFEEPGCELFGVIDEWGCTTFFDTYHEYCAYIDREYDPHEYWEDETI